MTEAPRQHQGSLHYLGATELDIPECHPTSTRHGEPGILGEGRTRSLAPEVRNAQGCGRMTREAMAVLTSRVYERSFRADGCFWSTDRSKFGAEGAGGAHAWVVHVLWVSE